MEGNFAKVSDNSRRVVEVKRKRATRISPQLPFYKSSAMKLGKRKKPDACKTKCRSCKLASHRSLVRYYTNIMKSGLPKRLMFYQNGEWIDHDFEVVGLVRKDFGDKKAMEVKFKCYHLFLDFVHMVQFNFRTTLEQPIAWIDDGGCCFFPEIYTHLDEQHVHSYPEIQKDEGHEPQEINLQIEVELNGVGDSKSMEYCGESSSLVKRIKFGRYAEIEDSFDKVSDMRMNEVIGENEHLEKQLDADIEKGKLDLNPDDVKEMFLIGMSSAPGTTVTNIVSNSGSICQDRLEIFLKQVEITNKHRGNPNVCYAWLPSSSEAASGILTYGVGLFGFQQMKSIYGLGVHLAAANCADARLHFPSFNFIFIYGYGLPFMHASVFLSSFFSPHTYHYTHLFICWHSHKGTCHSSFEKV